MMLLRALVASRLRLRLALCASVYLLFLVSEGIAQQVPTCTLSLVQNGTTVSPGAECTGVSGGTAFFNWGDGTAEDSVPINVDGKSAPLAHTYASNGQFTLTFRATGADNESSLDVACSPLLKGCTAANGVATVGITAAPVTVTVTPATAQVAVGQQQAFTASVTNATDQSVTWSVNGVAGGNETVGTITDAGVYTAPAQAPGPVQVTATSVAAPASAGLATVTVVAGIAVSITPNPPPALQPDQAQQFTATVAGTANQTVTWSATGSCGPAGGQACGSITQTGLYTAPPSPLSGPITDTVVATSAADPTKSDSVSITVAPATTATSVEVGPVVATLGAGSNTQLFTATINGVPAQATEVSWSVTGTGCSGGPCGSIDASTGLYTLAATQTATPTAEDTVTATLVGNTATTGIAKVRISSAAGLTIDPPAITITRSTPTQPSVQAFTAKANNAPAAVKWSITGISCSGGPCGTISPAGLYTAPAKLPTRATSLQDTITATTDTNGVASVIINIADVPAVTAGTPASPTIAAGRSTTVPITTQPGQQTGNGLSLTLKCDPQSLPRGMTCQFTPPVVTAGQNSTLTVTTTGQNTTARNASRPWNPLNLAAVLFPFLGVLLLADRSRKIAVAGTLIIVAIVAIAVACGGGGDGGGTTAGGTNQNVTPAGTYTVVVQAINTMTQTAVQQSQVTVTVQP